MFRVCSPDDVVRIKRGCRKILFAEFTLEYTMFFNIVYNRPANRIYAFKAPPGSAVGRHDVDQNKGPATSGVE